MITEKQYWRACGQVLKKEPNLDANELFTKVAKKLGLPFHEVCNFGIMLEINQALAEKVAEEREAKSKK